MAFRPEKKPTGKAAAKKAAARPKPKPRPDRVTDAAFAAAIDLPESVAGGFVPVNALLKYEAFVNAYLTHGSARQAAKDAGWACPTDNAFDQLAHRLLKNRDVLAMLNEQIKSIRLKHGVTVERTWAELARIAFLDPGDVLDSDGNLLPMGDVPEDARRCIAQVKVKEMTMGEDGHSVEREVKLYDKQAALAQLIKLQGLVQGDTINLVDGDAFLRAIEEGRKRMKNRPVAQRDDG